MRKIVYGMEYITFLHFLFTLSVEDGKEETKLSSKEEAEGGGKEHEMGLVFKSPISNNINLEAEQNAMRQQIVDMYMRSMQQFTESLAKMKLPDES